MRLTAAGLLDRAESQVMDLAGKVEHTLATVPDADAERRATLHLEAAALYAEMLYRRLAREGMAALYLRRWNEHLQQSETRLGHTPRWRLLRARWLEHSDSEASVEMYAAAAEAGAPPSRTVSYLAEHLWRQRRYRDLHALLAQSRLFTHLPISGRLKQRWSAGA